MNRLKRNSLKRAASMARRTRSLLSLALTSSLLLSVMVIYVYAAAGDLDPTFGTGGEVTTDFASSNDFANAMAIQSDGKIVAAGSARTSSNFVFALARYNPNGTLDSSFGSGGKVTTGFSGRDDEALAVAIQSDGKIVAAGYAFTGSDLDFALARYNTNGTLDTTFGSGGKVTTDFFGEIDAASGVAIQLDGKIVLAGRVRTGGNDDFGLARYNTDGLLDTIFGTGGKVTTDFSGDLDEALAIAIQLDGKIVAAGFARNTISDDFAVARYDGNGTLDTSFGTAGTGKVTTNFPGSAFGSGNAYASALAIQSDGKIVLAGNTSTGIGFCGPIYDFALARYNTNGTLDTAFGVGGKVTTDFSGGNQDFGSAVSIQLDGKILVAGSTSPVNSEGCPGGSSNFALVRYKADGNLDTSFGAGGKVRTAIGSGAAASAVTLQLDGKIVAAGLAIASTGYDFALARYEGLTPQDLTTTLSDQVQRLVNAGSLNSGQGNSLTTKLAQILNSVNQGNTNAACNQLDAFINEVNSLISSGVLSPADGQPLINVATGFKNLLGC